MDNYFFIRHNGTLVRLKFEEVVFVESLKNYCKIHTPGAVFIVLTSMKHLEQFFPAGEFIRIHKSYIVSVGYIHQLTNTQVCIAGKQCFPVGETYREKLKSFIAARLLVA